METYLPNDPKKPVSLHRLREFLDKDDLTSHETLEFLLELGKETSCENEQELIFYLLNFLVKCVRRVRSDLDDDISLLLYYRREDHRTALDLVQIGQQLPLTFLPHKDGEQSHTIPCSVYPEPNDDDFPKVLSYQERHFFKKVDLKKQGFVWEGFVWERVESLD